MTFREILAKVVDETQGAVGGAIMASDGIPVDEVSRDGTFDLGGLAVELQPLLEQGKQACASFYESGADMLQEMIFVTAGHQVLLRPLDSEYFLIVALQPDGLLGKARYMTRLMLRDLKETL